MKVKSVFSPRGLLSKHFDNYEHRPQQVEMAELVDKAIKAGNSAVIDGGTGVGKTFSYLVPLILSGKRAIISTSHKSLQDQLSRKDLPALKRALPVDFDWKVLKGKNNYFCPEHFQMYMVELEQLLTKHEIQEIAKWASKTKDGDVEYYPDELPPRVKELITCDTDTIHEKGSQFYNLCFAVKARNKAKSAQIVLVNHTLLALDIALRIKTDGQFGFLPETDIVVIDEAHTFEKYAVMAFSDAINMYSLLHLINQKFVMRIVSKADLKNLSRKFKANLKRFVPEKGQVYYQQKKFECFDGFHPIINLIEKVIHEVANSPKAQKGDINKKKAVEVFKEGSNLIDRLDEIEKEDDDMIRWSEARDKADGTTVVTLKSVPLTISDTLRRHLFKDKTVICTSATLAVNNSFDFFRYQMGVPEGALELIVGSPFDYKKNALVYISNGEQEKYWEIEQLIRFSKGNAFVLFTSYRDMYKFYEMVNTDYPKFIQSRNVSRARLLKEFKETPNAVLFATRSFWEGIDVRGDDLILVIIHKIPFENPSDLLYSSKIERIDEKLGKGKHWTRYTVPDACLKLKQGSGRLIRCFDFETELLTTDGWKKFDEIDSSMKAFGIPQIYLNKKIVTINGAPKLKENQILATKINYKPEPMIEITAKSLKAKITPDHTMFIQLPKTSYYKVTHKKPYGEYVYRQQYKKRANPYSKLATENLPSRFKMPLAGRIIRRPTKIPREWFRLMGLIITDGHISKSKNCIMINQSLSKPHVVKEIDRILKVLGIKANRYINPVKGTNMSVSGETKYQRTEDGVIWQISGVDSSRIRDLFTRGWRRRYTTSKSYRKKSHRGSNGKKVVGWKMVKEKNIPKWCLSKASRPQLLALLDGLMMGDGTWQRNSGTFYTSKRPLADMFQAILSLVGYRNSMRIRRNGQLKIGFSKNGSVDIVKNNSFSKSKSSPSWCVNTIYGNIIVRRKGSTFIAGNSKNGFGVIALLDSRVNFRNYGKAIVNTLPPARRTSKLENVRKFYKSKRA